MEIIMATKKTPADSNEKSDGKLSLKMDKAYPFKTRDHINEVVVIGCGGTGSYVIPGIARLLYSMKQQNKKIPTLTLIDADQVENKNLIRQNFSPGDVGRNKAEALATRYANAFGLEIAYQTTYLEKEGDIRNLFSSSDGGTLLIGCVDNIRTRFSIREAIRTYTNSYKNVYWIDTGNEEETGQVVLSARIPRWNRSGLSFVDDKRFPLPDIFDLYPELLERSKTAKFTSELSCAELAESSPQFGFVNNNAANFALNFAFDLLSQNEIKVHAVEFSIKNKVAHKTLCKSNIENWPKICSAYHDINMKNYLI